MKACFAILPTLSALPIVVLLACGTLPAEAELQGGGLEKAGGLNGAGLDGGRLKTGNLQGGNLQTSSLKNARLEPAKRKPGLKLASATTLKRKATELTEGGLGITEIRGAVSTIPETQVGELLYDVASLLMQEGAELRPVGVGYSMAVLADKKGARHDDALTRLKEIFLDRELKHDEAVRLYDGGLETMKGLVEIRIGLTADGHRAGLGTLQVVKAAYHQRRAKEVDEEPEAADMPKEDTDEGVEDTDVPDESR